MGVVAARLTGYWPFQSGLSAAERLMEGGVEGAAIWRGVRCVDPHTGRRPRLHTLEAYLRGEAPYVSVSGDPVLWPFGQRLELDAWPGVAFRLVDTGGHFTGPGKVYRVPGREPLDICVDSATTYIPLRNATATVYDGDAWGSGPVEYAAMGGGGGAADPFVLGDDQVAEWDEGDDETGLGEGVVIFGLALGALLLSR